MKNRSMCLYLCALTLCAKHAFGIVEVDSIQGGPNTALPTQIATMPVLSSSGFSVSSSLSTNDDFTPAPSGPPLNVGLFSIVIVPGPNLAANVPALLAFQAAANQWTSHFSDPVTITVNADLSTNFPSSNIIGSTSSVELQAGYNTIRNQLVTDATGQPNNSIVASLPTAAQFLASVPSGFSLSGNVSGTKASLKAAGFTGLDVQFGAADGTITFNSNFAFDYDRSNGVTPGQIDFQTVATHELGHLLGFTSSVDDIDGASAFAVTPTTLDLFRFTTATNPTNSANFTTTSRSLVPGANAITDDTVSEFAMSTGLTQGDGRQASHWKDDSLTGNYVGVMDPTLAFGVTEDITGADLRALDLIGYDLVAVPEPGSVLLLSLGIVGLAMNYRRQWRASRKQIMHSETPKDNRPIPIGSV